MITEQEPSKDAPPLPFSKGLTQAELTKHSGISTTNISLLENDRVEIGKRRVEQLAKAFDVHPAIIMFPDYEAKDDLARPHE